ncbi:ATP-binding protein [Mucilaginibacter sp. CSA2-8R]|uniref:AlbA family DNA-binding domain-containing protein n=1 Tax=Mucilaginibacter sp. CSA2-8R TaxID=3141542 RepID=UPI00315C877C
MFDQEYLTNLINNKIEENLNLDYKAAGALQRNDLKTKEISKDVSAFANSAGGVIVYGLKEDSLNKHLASEIDPIDRKTISKEWLEQIIQNSIQPRITGVIIHPIEIFDENRVVYVVEIPKGTTAHQAIDRKYYKRFNFSSEPMHDYEIKDIINRPKHPLINVSFSITIDHQDEIILELYFQNVGDVYAKYINCMVTLPTKCLEYMIDDLGYDEVAILKDNTIKDVVSYTNDRTPQPVYSAARFNPLLPGMRMRASLTPIILSKGYKECSIKWRLYADNAEMTEGTIELRDIKVNYE